MKMYKVDKLRQQIRETTTNETRGKKKAKKFKQDKEQLKQSVRDFVDEFPNMSNRDVANHLKSNGIRVSPQFVHAVKMHHLKNKKKEGKSNDLSTTIVGKDITACYKASVEDGQ